VKSHTEQIAISSSKDAVFDFVADAENLPSWATGFAKAVRRDGEAWVVDSPQGDVGLRVESDALSGVVDYVMEIGPGMTATGFSRVVAHGEASVYMFTLLQAPGMPDEAFKGQIESIRVELPTLKGLLEAR